MKTPEKMREITSSQQREQEESYKKYLEKVAAEKLAKDERRRQWILENVDRLIEVAQEKGIKNKRNYGGTFPCGDGGTLFEERWEAELLAQLIRESGFGATVEVWGGGYDSDLGSWPDSYYVTVSW